MERLRFYNVFVELELDDISLLTFEEILVIKELARDVVVEPLNTNCLITYAYSTRLG